MPPTNRMRKSMLPEKLPQLETNFEQLSEQFVDALKFLKKTKIDNQRKTLHDLPLFMVIGLPDAGKTSLLARSGLRFILAKRSQQSPRRIKPTTAFDWWATKEGLFLDVAGKYLKTTDDTTNTRKTWLHILQLLRRHRKSYVDGVIMTLDVSTLLSGTAKQRKHAIRLLKCALADMRSGLKSSIPVYLVFTGVDCLPGFHTFFAGLTPQEREQIWGFQLSLQHVSSSGVIVDRFDAEFDKLLQRLHQHMLARLHQESDQDALSAIKDFPLQFESIKKPLLSVLQQLSSAVYQKKQQCLRGVYFTSAGGKAQRVDTLLPAFERNFEVQAPVAHLSSLGDGGAFFIKQLFTQVVFPDVAVYRQFKKPSLLMQRRTTIMSVVAMLLIVVVCTKYWTDQFSNRITRLGQVEDALTRYELLNANVNFTDAEQALSAINDLLQISHHLQSIHQPWLSRLRHSSSDKLDAVSERVYNNAIGSMLSQQLQQVIQQQLSQGRALDPGVLYGAVATTMMLGDPQHFDKSMVKDWLQHYWQYELKIDPQTVSQMRHHVDHYLDDYHQPIQIDATLIASARHALYELPVEQLVLGMVEYHYVNQQRYLPLPVIDKQPVFLSEKSQIVLPALYTRGQFNHVYEKAIEDAATQLRFGNWILGVRVVQEMPDNFDNIVDQAKRYYMHQYIEHWQAILNRLTLESITDGVRLVKILDALGHDQSALNQLLKTIAYNTNIEYAHLQTPISMAFKRFNRFFENYQQGGFLTVGAHLNRLLDYVSDINSARDPQAAAFVAVKQRMLLSDVHDVFDDLYQQASIAPEPVKQWIFSLTHDAWHILLVQTSDYVQQRWQTHVMPVYSDQLAQYYPFNQQALSDASLESFNQFFAPKGVFARFFENYLLPFVDQSGATWQWRERDGLGLAFSEAALAQIQRANQIHYAFFPEHQMTAQMDFTLKTAGLSVGVKRFGVDMDDQYLHYSSSDRKAKVLHWPGNAPVHGVTLMVEDDAGHVAKKTEVGLWAWFKLFNAAEQYEVSKEQVKATFRLGGYLAQCEFDSDQTDNPLNPLLLQKLQLPAHLG